MYESVKGKKLLILGATALMCQVIRTAQEMGMYVIATDYNTDYSLSPGKLVADECWDISWNDTGALEQKCKECGVEGVFTAFSEFCVMAARRLCDRLGLPFYATAEQINITRDKAKFKKCCQKFGVPVVEEYLVSAEPTENEIEKIVFPVVVKPTDNAGSRGISVCYNSQELHEGIAKALPYSASNGFIVERCMIGQEVNITYTVRDGNISLSCMSDAHAGNQEYGQIKLTDGWLFPSRHLKAYIERCDELVKRMLRGIGLQNGVIFITGFYQDGQFYIFESGYRIGGGTTYNFIEANNGISFLKMMLMHSMTGKMQGGDVTASDNPFFKKCCCNLTVMVKPGVVGSVGSKEDILKIDGVLSVDMIHSVGQTIKNSGDLSQTFARVNIIADSAEKLADTISEVYNVIDIRMEDGSDMILSRLKHDAVAGYWN